MKLTHFKGCNNLDEVKALYKKLVIQYHPDKNPNVDIRIIQDLNAQYSYIQKNYISYPIDTPKQNYSSFGAEFNKGFSAFEEAIRWQAQQDKQKTQSQEDYFRNYNSTKRSRRNNKKRTTFYQDTDEKTIENTLNDLIHRGYEQVKERGYKPAALYFKFVDYCLTNNITASKSHFFLIAQLLGYKDYWVHVKYEEYLQQTKEK